MSENRPGPDEAEGKGAEDVAQSPSRRRVLKAAAAAAPIIMSIKARPAFAGPDTNSSSLSHNMSQQPAAARTNTK
jgi:PqqD family protein of HPr-rel-A system